MARLSTSGDLVWPLGEKSALWAWLLATRPKTLLASFCPVLMGTALAVRNGAFHGPSAAAALIGALAVQIGTNFCNDYFDFRQGADREDRLGPARAVQSGWISPGAMLLATAIAFAIVLVIATLLSWRAGWAMLAIGVGSVASGIWYTASRRSLAYTGLADPFVILFFGPVAVGGTYYVQTLAWQWPVAVAGLAPGLLATCLLAVNNLRDIDQDRRAGKRTLAVRFGASFARVEYVFVLSFVDYLRPLAVTCSLVLLAALPSTRQLWQRAGRDLNPMLGRTAAVLTLYTALFSFGCLAHWW